MKAALINPVTNIVENVALWDDDSTDPPGFTVVLVEDNAFVGPGFTYDGTEFHPPITEA